MLKITKAAPGINFSKSFQYIGGIGCMRVLLDSLEQNISLAECLANLWAAQYTLRPQATTTSRKGIAIAIFFIHFNQITSTTESTR